ncbi:RNA polymerase II subunit A C-terminal domain phosphatase isoform X2 [Tenrec ecaudatus]|uniref:RNA polymerase II subunit A C-terminal domain phosphatase isoform X2 n=1 Tax=Tenrec ecaudatus TaxID=94439 RepID=UPI003F59E3DD
MEARGGGRGPVEGSPSSADAEVRCPGPAPLRLLEWKVAAGTTVRIGSVLAVCSPEPSGAPAASGAAGRRLRSERAGVVRELCAQPGQLMTPGTVLLRVEACSHPVVMKGLCAECGQDLTQLQSKNGRQRAPLSTATVSMVHSVPELMVSSEQAELLAREDQQRLHRTRKLVLMVDLDQTLIHTTEQLCQQMSNKGIFHFQLGRGEPMLHTRLRPHCREFLEKVARLYELHVFTFGSRLYAHTIAGFLDPEKKLFSHRILSRDECIDPFSKTGNLRNLFPCGDSMVCIIDDREDVWKFAPNLITVKKYTYFQGTGDINALPGSREAPMRRKGADAPEHVLPRKDPVDGKPAPGLGQSNGLGRSPPEVNGGKAGTGPPPSRDMPTREKVDDGDPARRAPGTVTDGGEPGGVEGPPATLEQGGRAPSEQQPAQGTAGSDLEFDLSSDSESNSEPDGHRSSTSDSDNDGRRGHRKPRALRRGRSADPEAEKPAGIAISGMGAPSVRPPDRDPELEAAEEGDPGGLCDLGNGCADRKEAETESQNSEQSGVTVGESLDQSMEEEDEEEDVDHDDHLVHLEEILARVHSDYYAKYDRFLSQETTEAPDIRRIVPELKSKVLANVTIAFSGLHPTSFPVEKTREHYHATALGARVLTNLVLSPDDPNRATHLIAARAGTEKVRQAQECRHLHVVSPDWLWSCLERWDKVEERLFPLRDDYTRAQRENSPAAFASRQSAFHTAVFHPTPVHPRSLPSPEACAYDPSTGKPVRKGTQPMPLPHSQAPVPPSSLAPHGEHSSFRVVEPHQQQMGDGEPRAHPTEEQPGPSRRKRQPSMSEAMPLYTLCKEDLERMDKEVDDILGEGSDDSDGEKKPEEQEGKPRRRAAGALGARTEPQPTAAASWSGEQSPAGGAVPRGRKRKLNEEDAASVSSKESSNEDEEGSSSEADEMAAALEAELSDFM